MKRRWTDDELRAAIAASRSFRRAAAALGVVGRVGIEKRARELGLDTSHFRRWAQATTWTDADLRTAVRESISIAGVLRRLGLRAAGANYAGIGARIAELGLDTCHFRGQAWNRGLTFRPNAPIPLHDVLVRGRPTTTHRLKRRLIREGLKPAHCELCGWAERAPDGRVPLELDHINGDRDDNRIENRRILCPNCHSLQPTHRGLNRRSRRQR